jgi:hypothetical protein
MKLSIKQSSQSFASFLLAFSLFGFVLPRHLNSANGHHHANFVNPSEVQQNDDDSGYKAPRSPGFHDDFGS